MLGVHLGPRAAFREDAGFPGELEASSRPPASRGRNAKDQLSAELRLPFRGAPGAGPSRAAELTGSVCPTGRAAPAKNSALPCAGRREPGQRPWESGPRQSKEPGEPRTPLPGPGPVPPPRPRRRPPAQRCPHRCGGGWKAHGRRSGRGRPGWGPAARPPALSPGPPCPCWGLRPARSARTRFAAEVRQGRLPSCAGSSRALTGASFSLPTPGPRRGASRQNPGIRAGLWEWGQALSANSSLV